MDWSILFGTFFALVLWVIVVGLWIFTLVKQLREKEYYWFVFTLIISPVLVIYWIGKALQKLD